jgi:hypothetical protein
VPSFCFVFGFSQRHARSKKLLGEGRLKLMLNSDGELEEEQETHAERHARTIAISQVFTLFIKNFNLSWPMYFLELSCYPV